MNRIVPTMLSSSKVPQPSFACRWPSRPSAASRPAYSARLSPFISRCCQSMLTLTLSIPWRRSEWITCSVIPMLRIRIFIAGSEFLCSRKTVTPRSFACCAACADAVDEARPGLLVRRLERVVVALDPGPDDHVGAGLAGEVDRLARQPQRLLAGRVVGRAERALAEAGVEVEAARDAVDPVPVERVADLVEVRRRELLRVVELVVVDQVAEPLDRRPHLLGRRLAGQLGLVAGRVEAGRHVAEGPDAETTSSCVPFRTQAAVFGGRVVVMPGSLASRSSPSGSSSSSASTLTRHVRSPRSKIIVPRGLSRQANRSCARPQPERGAEERERRVGIALLLPRR